MLYGFDGLDLGWCMEDFVRQLGYLCLGSRLKRLGEHIQTDVSRFTQGAGVELQVGQYPLIGVLGEQGPLTISQLVTALGVSQPGITRTVTRLAAMGLVEVSRQHRDQRHKTVALSAIGQRLVERSKRELWPAIEAAVREMCDGLVGSLLDQVGAIEDALEQVPLDHRVARHAS
jgi:DNA-binding MarR family transcriptional regulator